MLGLESQQRHAALSRRSPTARSPGAAPARQLRRCLQPRAPPAPCATRRAPHSGTRRTPARTAVGSRLMSSQNECMCRSPEDLSPCRPHRTQAGTSCGRVLLLGLDPCGRIFGDQRASEARQRFHRQLTIGDPQGLGLDCDALSCGAVPAAAPRAGSGPAAGSPGAGR